MILQAHVQIEHLVGVQCRQVAVRTSMQINLYAVCVHAIFTVYRHNIKFFVSYMMNPWQEIAFTWQLTDRLLEMEVAFVLLMTRRDLDNILTMQKEAMGGKC